ncbi:MAG: carboxypeptidase regulatory-like domain-containing protein [Pedobacter sp.]|nr:MAG: carboxypeptidase regulatory-like domain-containing protein [Pedobacter sp.]
MSVAFIFKGADPVDKIVTALQSWSDNHPQEKVYLHTDKPYYLVGDTIWFKAYVTIGSKNQLSALSGALYVDLISESDSVGGSLKLPVSAGMTKGNFVLADTSFREGNYRIRAYTNWMRNTGSGFFYDKVFSVGSSVVNNVLAKIDYNYSVVDGKNTVTAIVSYTNDKGEPYINKPVNYQYLESGETLFNGKQQTDDKGQIRVVLKPGKSGKIDGTTLLTKIIAVEKEIAVKDFAIKAVSLKTDVQFFPESGPLVNGVRTRVAFKATGVNGLGIPVKGVVVDNANTEVAQFEATHAGMGFFRMLPEAGKSYQAKITYPDGSENVVKLPAAVDNGYVMGVFNNTETDTILVRINASPAQLATPGSQVSLVIQSGGNVHFASTIPITKPAVSVTLPAKDLPSGIVQFTLFSADGTPLNERIAFVQNNDQLDLKLSSAKTTYGAREKVEIMVDAADPKGAPVRSNFSVSVINEATVPIEETKENTIFSHLLLSSDINGYIERPNYYFYNPSAETKANLDLLMMTQGYRRFVWKNLFTTNPFVPEHKAEKIVTNVTGTLLSLSNKPVVGGKILMFSNKVAALPLDTVTDANGKFKFSNLVITSEVQFSVQGTTDKGSKNVEISVDRAKEQAMTPNRNIPDLNTNIMESLKASMDNSKKLEQDLQSRGMLGRTQMLREVVISAAKRSKKKFGLNHALEGHADQSVAYREDDATFNNLWDWMKFRISGAISFEQQNNNDCGLVYVAKTRGEIMRIIVDGVQIDDCTAQAFFESDPSSIQRVDVVRTNLALIAYVGGPALSFITKRGVGILTKTYNPHITSFNPRGFNVVKEFYSPKYNNDDNDSKVADLRSTIYWNPSVVTDATGKAKLNFFNADSRGKYRVVIEGLNADGILGRQVYRYEVK